MGRATSVFHLSYVDLTGHKHGARVDRADVLAADVEGRSVGFVDVNREALGQAMTPAEYLERRDEAGLVSVGTAGKVVGPLRTDLRHAVEKRVGHGGGRERA